MAAPKPSISSPQFLLHLLRGRWLVIFSSILIMSAAGATYIFGIYSKDIKSSLGYNQETLNTLGFFKDLGANLGVISGLINEVTPPWVVLFIGAAMNLSGYLMIYLAITEKISKPKFWQMCLYIFIGADSQSFANTGSLVTCVKNFPESRGVVLGLLKGFVGLSGAMFTQLYNALYGNNSKSLVLLIAWLPAAISILSLPVIRLMRPIPGNGKSELKVFYYFLYVSLALAGYLMAAIIAQKRVSFSRAAFAASAAIVVAILFVPLVIVFRVELKIWAAKMQDLTSISVEKVGEEKGKIRVSKGEEREEEEEEKAAEEKKRTLWKRVIRVFRGPEREENTKPQALRSISIDKSQEEKRKIRVSKGEQREEEEEEKAAEEKRKIKVSKGEERAEEEEEEKFAEEKKRTLWKRVIRVFRGPERGEDYTILQALVSVDMIILFIASICGIGGTLTAIDNMGQIGESLGYPPQSIATFVSLISIWNYLGRVFAGFCSEIILVKFHFPRTLFLTLILLLSCVGHLLIAFGLPGSLYVASVIIGFTFGAQWPLLFAIISELFGLKYYSTLYNFGAVASPVGAYILNVKVAGKLYDVEAAKQRAAGLATAAAAKVGGEDISCVGVRCFRLSFLIITGATLFGVVVSLLLVVRTREFYRSDIYAKFREGREEKEEKKKEEKETIARG